MSADHATGDKPQQDVGDRPLSHRDIAIIALPIMLSNATVPLVGYVNTVVVEAAEVAWPGYASELRTDPEEPDCSLEELDDRLGRLKESAGR